MQEYGYRIIPVNPMYTEVLGEKCFASLAEVPEQIDIVDCFRKSEEMPALAEQAIAMGAGCLWMQLGVANAAAAAIASRAGLDVVADRCVKIEHARLFGGLNFVGVNTRIISAKRPVF
jgi:predicted CoA-binding protein